MHHRRKSFHPLAAATNAYATECMPATADPSTTVHRPQAPSELPDVPPEMVEQLQRGTAAPRWTASTTIIMEDLCRALHVASEQEMKVLLRSSNYSQCHWQWTRLSLVCRVGLAELPHPLGKCLQGCGHGAGQRFQTSDADEEDLPTRPGDYKTNAMVFGQCQPPVRKSGLLVLSPCLAEDPVSKVLFYPVYSPPSVCGVHVIQTQHFTWLCISTAQCGLGKALPQRHLPGNAGTLWLMTRTPCMSPSWAPSNGGTWSQTLPCSKSRCGRT